MAQIPNIVEVQKELDPRTSVWDLTGFLQICPDHGRRKKIKRSVQRRKKQGSKTVIAKECQGSSSNWKTQKCNRLFSMFSNVSQSHRTDMRRWCGKISPRPGTEVADTEEHWGGEVLQRPGEQSFEMSHQRSWQGKFRCCESSGNERLGGSKGGTALTWQMEGVGGLTSLWSAKVDFKLRVLGMVPEMIRWWV